MRIFVTGATGFVGRALIPLLQRAGHDVIVWTRSASRARGVLGADVDVHASNQPFASLVSLLSRCDAVVNLAGEPIIAGRWTPARRAAIEASRVERTDDLVRAIAAASPRPRVLVSASAVGYYGDRGSELLTERSSPGRDYLAEVCRRWEAAANAAESHGVRVVCLRIGVVLGRDGGALARMLPPFLVGAGGPIGTGRQYFPWIHLRDLVRVIATAIADGRYRGAINAVSPEPVTNRDFASALGRVLRRPSLVPVPALVLRVVFGEAAIVLLASQRVRPETLSALGFEYEFPALDAALDACVNGIAVTIGPADANAEPGRRARYVLRAESIVDAPLDDAFAFFSKAENLGLLTPSAMRFAIDGAAPPIHEGAEIRYRLRVGPIPIAWTTRIVRWEPGRRFVDRQESGPYAFWWHEHAFRAEADRTRMEDRVYYTPPFGILGRLANRLFIVPSLRRIFQYRGDVIRLRFGAAA